MTMQTTPSLKQATGLNLRPWNSRSTPDLNSLPTYTMLLHTPNSTGTTILPLFRPTAGPGAYQIMAMHRPTGTPNYKKNDNFNTIQVHIWTKGISSNGNKGTEAVQLWISRSNTAMTSTRIHRCPDPTSMVLGTQTTLSTNKQGLSYLPRN